MTTEAIQVEATVPPVAHVPAVAPPAPLEVSVNATGVPPAEAATKVEPVAYNPTGDVGLDMTLKFVGDLGYAPDHPAMKAAIDGNFALLEAELASKGVKGYEAFIKLGQKAYSEVSAKTQERQAKDKEAVEKIAGGADNWSAMTSWAATNADESERASLTAMLGKGGIEAQMAATWLSSNYNRSNNASTDGAGAAVAAVKGQPTVSSGALGPKEYGAEVVKARAAHSGGDFESSTAYQQLAQRRMAWRG